MHCKSIRMLIVLLLMILSCFQNGYSFEIILSKQWNLISLPDQPSDTGIKSVTASIAGKFGSVWSFIDGGWKLYDPQNPEFSDLQTMEGGHGYWIDMKETAVLSGSGKMAPAFVPLNLGWNLVGYGCKSMEISSALASIDGKYDSVWGFKDGAWKYYDPANPGFSDLTTVDPQCGYWINAKEATLWTCPDDYAPKPVVSGDTTPETSGKLTLNTSSPSAALKDGTKLTFQGMGQGSDMTLTLDRATNVMDSGSGDIMKSGSMRTLTVDAVTYNGTDDISIFSPVLTIPQKEVGNLNLNYVNILRISIDPDTGEENRHFLPVFKNQNGDIVVRDWMLPSEILGGTSSSAVGALLFHNSAAGPKVIKYSPVTIQSEDNTAVSAQLVRMVPMKGHDWKRVPVSKVLTQQSEKELKKPVQNVIVFVHGHNEMEKVGFEVHNSADPWLYDYKKDVWNYMYDKIWSDFSDREGCTVFYEYIYPSWRSIFTHLNDDLARQLKDALTPQLKNGMKFNLFIVAHSMGGVVSRAGVIRFDAKLKEYLQRLVTWGSPHHGSPLNSMRFALSSPALASRQNTVALKVLRHYGVKAVFPTQGVHDLRWTADVFDLGEKLQMDKVFRWYGDSSDPKAWEKWNTGTGTMLYNDDLWSMNLADDMGNKYSFLFGITNENLKLKDWSEFGVTTLYSFNNLSPIGQGATLAYLLVGNPSNPFMGNQQGDSDGVAPIPSMAGYKITSNAPYLGIVNHEQYFNSTELAPKTATETFKAMDFGNSKYACPKIELTSPANGQTFGLTVQVPVAGKLVWPGDDKPGKRIKAIQVKSVSSGKSVTLKDPVIKEDGNFTGEFTAGDLADTNSQNLAASALMVILQFLDNTELSLPLGKLAITSVSCDYSPPTARITISGEGFGSTQGNSTITLNGVKLTATDTWTDKYITVWLPADAASGDIVVTVNGLISNAYPYVIDKDFSSKLSVRPNYRLYIETDPASWCMMTVPDHNGVLQSYATDTNDPDLKLSQTTPGRISGTFHKAKSYGSDVKCTHTTDISFENIPLSNWCTCWVNCDSLIGCQPEYCADPPSFIYSDVRKPKNKIVYKWSYTCDDGTSGSFNSDECIYPYFYISASVYFTRE